MDEDTAGDVSKVRRQVGEADLLVQCQPDRRIKATDGFQVPPETPHSVRNGDKPLKLAVTYVVEKDKPLVTLVPE